MKLFFEKLFEILSGLSSACPNWVQKCSSFVRWVFRFGFLRSLDVIDWFFRCLYFPQDENLEDEGLELVPVFKFLEEAFAIVEYSFWSNDFPALWPFFPLLSIMLTRVFTSCSRLTTLSTLLSSARFIAAISWSLACKSMDDCFSTIWAFFSNSCSLSSRASHYFSFSSRRSMIESEWSFICCSTLMWFRMSPSYFWIISS